MSAVSRIVGRPVTILVLFLAVTVFGVFAYRQLAVAFFPEVDPPVMMINTSYDAGPEEVEESVTKPLEAALASVSGLDTMTSTSSDGSSRIVLEFDWETDLTEATNDVRDLLDRAAGSLPEEAEDPRIFKFDPNSQSIMTIALSGERTPEELRLLADEELQSPLERVIGVAQVEVEGGRTEVVDVDLNSAALEEYGLTVTGVANALAQANSDASGGEIAIDNRELLVRSTGEFESLRELEQAVVGYAGGAAGERPVLLEEIAEVAFDYEEATSFVRVDGNPAVTLSITAESGTNTVEVAEAVRAALKPLSELIPEGVTLQITSDSSTATKDTLEQVTSSLLIGGGLAMLVLLLFLHNVRAALIIGVSIPVSLLATVLAMSFGGVTLNLLSMSGLILGIGMIVDSSIVVLENIDRHQREGAELHEAATKGTGEMITAITASALTTISVFIPILVFKDNLGIMGILFGDIAFVIIVAILSSLAVAALLVPVLSSTYIPLKGYGEKKRNVLTRVGDAVARFLGCLESGYGWILRGALRRRGLVLSVAVALLIVSLSFVPSLGFIFSPPTAEDNVSVSISLREGTELSETVNAANDVAGWIRQNIDVAETIVVQSGRDGSNSARIEVGLPSINEVSYDSQAIQSEIRAYIASQPGIDISFGQNRGRRLSGGDPIDIVVQSDDLEGATLVATEIEELLKGEFPEVTEPSTDLGEASPELVVDIDHSRAADFGITVSQITSEVRAAINGTTATRFEKDGTEWDVVVALADGQRQDIGDLEAVFVTTQDRIRVPVSSLATVRLDQGLTQINRENETRTIHVTGGLEEGALISDVQPRIESRIDEALDIPSGVRVSFSGELSEFAETGSQPGIVFAVAVLLVFGIMASQFESFRMPFIIFFTIPLMLVGTVAIYVIVGDPVSTFSLVGVVVLAGIVVNNGIVLVDYTNLLRTRGYELFDAALEAGKTRFRPILMTTLTTILGMVPLAFFPGDGGELTQPVGMTVVGGLASSAFLTLFVVPVLYTFFAPKGGVRKQDALAVE